METRCSVNGKGLADCKVPNISNPESILTVDLSNNKIKSGDGLEVFTKLQTLILTKNKIESLKTFPSIPTLQTLNLDHNNMDDVYETIKYIKEKFPSLTSLSVLDNPFSPKAGTTQYALFRNRISDNLGQIAVLDGSAVEKANDAVGMLLRDAEKKSKPEEKKEVAEQAKQAIIMIKKKAVVKATIENLSERILKSHSEGNRFITNDDL
eukprot:TRINITY_DN2528_c0_g1_i1.p2 TRINITY_DN2528_c0_g1~~TRINITY_DN2528_c0_g1_i1.p2  ORF type:complete len:209 (-),score=73.36 TRINITY_DN2528_c0_g1_i1:146-772(-)